VSGATPIRASNDFSFEAEEAAIAEAASGINPLDQRMRRELAIPSAGAKDRADVLAEDRFLALTVRSQGRSLRSAQGRFSRFAEPQRNGRYLRGAASDADVSRMMLLHLRSIRLIRAVLHLCLLC
jgi:hypothetical protein